MKLFDMIMGNEKTLHTWGWLQKASYIVVEFLVDLNIAQTSLHILRLTWSWDKCATGADCKGETLKHLVFL
jgi:hypothetical protein